MRFGILRKKPVVAVANGDQTKVDDAPIEVLGREHYHKIEEQLGYKFQDLILLEYAMTHRSAQNRSGGHKNDYERLEFLGDAVLDLAVAHLLLDAHPEAREGDLSKMRAALVNTAALAEYAKQLNLGAYIKLSRGELAHGGAERPSILADVFEALMGAVYREGGFVIAKSCTERLFGEAIQTVSPSDPKTELQEALHAAGSAAPEYLLECVEGPEHSPTFVSIVKVDGQIVGRGQGKTKKESQQAAASEALSRMRGEDDIDRMLLVAKPTSTTAIPTENEEVAE